MNFKDKLTKKLLETGKKHRLLVYPTLALVAVITAISHAVYWGRGNGKRFVASTMIVALLITQSLFLTSSANVVTDEEPTETTAVDIDLTEEVVLDDSDEVIQVTTESPEVDVIDTSSEQTDQTTETTETTEVADDTETTVTEVDDSQQTEESTTTESTTTESNTDLVVNTQVSLLGDAATPTVNLYRVDENGNTYKITGVSQTVEEGSTEGKVKLDIPTGDEALGLWLVNNLSLDSTHKAYFTSTEVCTDLACTNTLDRSGDSIEVLERTDATYNFYVKFTRTSYPVQIDVDGTTVSGGTATAAYTDGYSDILPGDTNPVATYDIPSATASIFSSLNADGDDTVDGGAYAWGKTYVGLSDGTSKWTYSADGGNTKEIKVVGELTTSISLYAIWQNQTFEVTYNYADANVKEDTLVKKPDKNPKTYIYNDDTMVLVSSSELTTSNAGYYLYAWTDGTTEYLANGVARNSSEFAEKGDDITKAENMVGKTLNAVWEYRGNTLNVSGTGATITTDSSGNPVLNISGTYGQEIDCTVWAEYLSSDETTQGSTDFGLLIDDTNIGALASKYGLSVVVNQSDNSKVRSYRIYGVLKGVTTGYTVPMTVTDYNKSTEQTYTYSVNVVSKQMEVQIDPTTIRYNSETINAAPYKSYDGSADIEVKPKASVTGLTGDDVYVTFDTIAELDNKNAGTNKAVTLKNVVLGGSQAENYILTGYNTGTSNITVEGVATVHRIPVEVETVLVDDSVSTVLFGEQTPEYTVKLKADSEAALIGEDKTLYANDRDSFMATYVGFTGWSTNRTLYSPEGTYTMTPVFDQTNANYVVTAAGSSSEFTVARDDGDNYYVTSPSETVGTGGYYQSLTITPANGYDMIRIIEDGNDIAVGSDYATVKSMFSSAVTLTDDMTDANITFQMMNSATGAITYPVTIGDINIDGTGPTLVACEVSPTFEYFNVFGFGSYYHAQEIDGVKVESVKITFKYTSKDSKCDKLVYYFTDENGDVKGSYYGEVALVKSVGENDIYTATVTIGTDKSGQLIVYALDETTNSSAKNKIKFEEWIDLIEEGQQSSENYYEWMVENIINSADIDVTDANGNVAVADVWYNQLNCSVLAADDDSGVNKIVWTITDPNGATTEVEQSVHSGVAISYNKLLSYEFNTAISGDEAMVGEYLVSAVLYDNAGNSVALDQKGPFLFDGKAPTITCDDFVPEDGKYLAGVAFEFTVTEGEDESGVASVDLYYMADGEKTLLKNWGARDSYSIDITANGTYLIAATDKAGNVAEREMTFSGISTVVPDAPIINVTGTIGNDDWYIGEMPTVTILSSDTTSDGVPVTTTYKLTIGGNQLQANVDSVEEDIILTSEGEILVEAWSKSKANCVSETTSKTVKVDVNGPVVTITDSTVDSDGNTVINFTVTDSVSGVNPDKIYVNDELVTVSDDNGVITGSFIANNNQTYSIVAEDIAGNVSDATDFVPLTLKASPIINITPTGAYLEAFVYEGTNPISDCYIAYKKASSSYYDTALSNKHDEDYGVSMDYTFRNLESNTVYDYRIYAIAANSNEVKIIEGSFRTADLSSTATVYGSVTYDEDLLDVYKTYPVYVALYDANTVIAGVQLESEEDTDYLFKNVADGKYRIVATNGMLSEVSTVTVTNGGISYPTDYASNGGIHFVLDGLSTDVVIKDNSISLTADGLEKIYNTALYNGNVTDADLEVVAAGGTIDITLYASYMDVSEVGKTTESIFIDKIGANGVIERYIQLEVIKEVRDVDGKLVNGTPTNITRLAEPVTISFPLGELSGQKIYVASVHGSGDKYTYVNWGGSDVTLTQNYVTITTDRFSVYALYRLLESTKEYTVKWVDGDGNIMKTETVVEGKAATPPTETPTKTETDKYTYTFSGWDTDYSSISKDTIISAWFVANKKAGTGSTTDTENSSGSTTDGSKDDITKEPTNYPYMGSGVSPKTGDEAPLMALAALMLMSGVGLVLVNKKRKED